MNELLSLIVLVGGLGLGGGAAWALARAGANRPRRNGDPWVGI